MSNSFDHDRVSESLPAFLEGTLADGDAAKVEEHLATCEDCRLEAVAVTALQAPVETSLTDHERLTLEHRVMAGIADDSPATVTELAPRKTVGRRLAQVMGAAATIAVLATLIYLGSSMSGGDDSENAVTGADGVEQAEESVRDSDEKRRKRAGPESLAAADSDGGAGGGAGNAAGEDATTGFKAPPEPRFSVADGPFTSADLQKLGESSLASVTFAHYYTARDADGRDALLDQLVAAAEASSGPEVSSQVYECGLQVLDTEDPTIPTFGWLAELDGTPVLVLGFVWTRSSTGPLDRYMVWAWERGDCATAVDFVDGRVETAG